MTVPLRTELLAPAGTPDAGYAALHYGADAVYLGLTRFSARAEAGNFTPGELADFTGYAHSLSPRRNVYLALNTLVDNAELADAAGTLHDGADAGIDAAIVQDLGIMSLVRDSFPDLPFHASTQLAIHNLDGALAARDLGFRRVTLARELTLGEIEAIAGKSGLETETFVHGALCYSYSGLCLFSALASGRSGNRGRCSYPCRARAAVRGRRAACHPFSLKDLALRGRARDLANAGVLSLKIEGRKKSPLYVAAVVDYYRRLLDGSLDQDGAEELEARMRTVFARSWTRFFLDGAGDPGVIDLDVAGHRGAPIGRIENIVRIGNGKAAAFRTGLALERHDGLQIDIPGEPYPFGFPVAALYAREGGRWKNVFAAAAGGEVAVPVPGDAPPLEPGLPLYLSSSQATKRAYPYHKPKPGSTRERRMVDWSLELRLGETAGRGMVVCTAAARLPAAYFAEAILDGDRDAAGVRWEGGWEVEAFPARDAVAAEAAAKTAFSRLGDFGLVAGVWQFGNPDRLFLRAKTWNAIRREAVAGLAAALDVRKEDLKEKWIRSIRVDAEAAEAPTPAAPLRSIYVERLEYLECFMADDCSRLDEIAIELPSAPGPKWIRGIESLAEMVGRKKIRLALPPIARDTAPGKKEKELRRLRDAGFSRWLAAGIGGWRLLRALDVEMSADWPLYAVNRLAASQLLGMGFSSFTLSPEDSEDNMAATVRAFPGKAVLAAWMHPPMFISASCVHANLGLCRGARPDACGQPPPLAIVMRDGLELTATPAPCGTVVSRDLPLDLSDRAKRLAELGLAATRMDFRWRKFAADEVLRRWRS
ncbi:MAG: U32 family peptidase [Planctomycetota bacterium]|nr:U32 family peptidase [Planctomycetota bacterium]